MTLPQTPSWLGRGIPPPYTYPPRPLRRLDPRAFGIRQSAIWRLHLCPHTKNAAGAQDPPTVLLTNRTLLMIVL